MAYVKKNGFSLQASRRHDQDSWCRIFLWLQHFNKIVGETTCDGCIACVTFFLHETSLLLVSLFYGKCYVTMFIREYVAFSYRYWGKFLPKMRRNCLESCFFIENVGFLFSFPSFLESIFFWAFLSATFYIFFWVVNDLTDFVGFAIYFFFIVMKRHNRFFELVTSVLSQRDVVKPWVWLHKLHELPS